MWGVGWPNITDIPFNFYAEPGVWYDALVTHDGSLLKFYINGNLTNQVEYESDVFVSPLIMGKKMGGYPDRQWFNGAISRVLVYNRNLNQMKHRFLQHLQILPNRWSNSSLFFTN